MSKISVSLQAASELLKVYDNYLIVAHERPDGDAVGSCEALRLALSEIGKNAVCVCSSKVPSYLRFICENEFIAPDSLDKLPAYDKIIAVDTASSELLGSVFAPLADRIFIKFDHHRTGSDFADYNYTDPEASAAGEVIYTLASYLGTQNPKIGAACYMAVASDTGCFRYSNTTSKTFAIASEIAEAGIDTSGINLKLFENKSYDQIIATSLGLCEMRLLCEGQAAFVMITNEFKKKRQLRDEHFTEVASSMREIEGVELSAVLHQVDGNDETFRLSVRSKEKIDCAAFCATFGGGGHLRASGATITAASPEDAEKKILDKIPELFV